MNRAATAHEDLDNVHPRRAQAGLESQGPRRLTEAPPQLRRDPIRGAEASRPTPALHLDRHQHRAVARHQVQLRPARPQAPRQELQARPGEGPGGDALAGEAQLGVGQDQPAGHGPRGQLQEQSPQQASEEPAPPMATRG